MRARIRPSDRISRAQKDAIHQYTQEELMRQQKDSVRRLFKLMCVSLNEEFGFGKQRLGRLVSSINSLAEEHANDEVYWTHIDRIMDEIGMKFEHENYDLMDR